MLNSETLKDNPELAEALVGIWYEKHNLLGENVKSKDAVGIQTPTSTLGSASNVKLRFDPSYMTLAADGKL